MNYPFTGYIVEYKESGQDQWKISGQVKQLAYTVPQLHSANEYYFRVKAINQNGVGESVDLVQPISPRDQVN